MALKMGLPRMGTYLDEMLLSLDQLGQLLLRLMDMRMDLQLEDPRMDLKLVELLLLTLLENIHLDLHLDKVALAL